MKHVIFFSAAFLISIGLIIFFLTSQTKEIMPGATSIDIVGDCKIIKFDARLQPFVTIVLACPKIDMIRLLPFPIQQPWFEDWWEKPGEDFGIKG
jgi:hypothetical protein